MIKYQTCKLFKKNSQFNESGHFEDRNKILKKIIINSKIHFFNQ